MAIVLTGAGALPFLMGAAMVLGFWPGEGRALIVAYGVVILSFMSGVLWGFASRTGSVAWAYGLSVLPALYAFFFALRHPWAMEGQALSHLIAGFLGVLVLDMVFQAKALAPRWWLTLRIPATAVVLACLWVARHA
ncbi:MAG: Protein of unknown function (DUF3429) [Rhodobacteraceae bacterium HLUCCA12]|nr:MAG: Protein of unknown function (DUF3429) [Rhodobacteraceae bacterium HLUCCA12]